MPEERVSESELMDDDIDPSALEKLSSMMDDDGNLAPHGEKHETEDEVEVPEPQTQQQAPDAKPDGEAASQEQTVEAEYEGKKYTVPAELKDALLRQSDYTRKTQEVATERAAVQQERQLVQRQAQTATKFVAAYAAVQQVESQMQQLLTAQSQLQPGTDPISEIQIEQALNRFGNLRHQMIGEIQKAQMDLQEQETHESQRQFIEQVQKSEVILKKEIPGWGTPELKQELLDTAVNRLGYTKDELVLSDHRQVKALYDLSQYYKLMEGQKAAQKRIERAPPRPVRASSNVDRTDSAPRNDALNRLKKTGRDSDAMEALRNLGIG